MNKFTQQEGLEYAREHEEFDIPKSKRKGGFYQLYRDIQDDPLWESSEPFCKRVAWIDLQLSAKFTKGKEPRPFKDRTIMIGRGQLVASNRFLKKRWHWKSVVKVQYFLSYLRKAGKISQQISQGYTVITICDYGR